MWCRQGTGLGSTGEGITEPIKAQVKNDMLGVGTSDPSTVAENDDIYEAYKKRMMTYALRPVLLLARALGGEVARVTEVSDDCLSLSLSPHSAYRYRPNPLNNPRRQYY